MSDTEVRSPRLKYTIFKPYQQNKGALASWEFTPDKNSLFLVMLPEENEKFVSEKRINIKLGLSDVSEMLLVLLGRKDGCGQLKDSKWSGIFHKNSKGSSSISFETRKEGTGFVLSVGRKPDGGTVQRIGLGLTEGEGLLLSEYFRHILPRLFVDDYNPNSNQD